MSPALGGAVELLERSLAFTGTALGHVDEGSAGGLGVPTPCDRWDLGQLLHHMDDALDAFREAAAGVVAGGSVAPTGDDHGGSSTALVDRLRTKACLLLGVWLDAPAARVDVGGSALEAPVLVATAALEITVHGWDVAQACGAGTRIPADLAAALHGVAHGVLLDPDRPGRFAGPLPTAVGAAPDERLLAYLGRVHRPGDGHPGSFRARQGLPSRAAS